MKYPRTNRNDLIFVDRFNGYVSIETETERARGRGVGKKVGSMLTALIENIRPIQQPLDGFRTDGNGDRNAPLLPAAETAV